MKQTNIIFKVFLLTLLSFFFLGKMQSFAQCDELIWRDEFDEASVNASKWSFQNGDGCDIGLCGWGNAELQWYQPQNTTISNGILRITAKNEFSNGYNYTSSKLITQGKFEMKHGRVEARMKLPSAGGVWPAFWMLPDPSNWPHTGEIDIMESKHKNPKEVGGTIHYSGAKGYAFSPGSYHSTEDLSQGFHTYAIEWSPDYIKWFVDGELYHEVTPETTVGKGWPFNDDHFYIILNVAVGGPGTWYTGRIDPTPSDYPTTLEVDYVRVFTGKYKYSIVGDKNVYNGGASSAYSIAPIPGASYSWTVPTGAQITSGQGTNSIKVNWGTTSGEVKLTATIANCSSVTYSKMVTVHPPLANEVALENFQNERHLNYTNVTGIFQQSAANPAPNSVNNSSVVGKYVRNTSEQYDNLTAQTSRLGSASFFMNNTKRIRMDVYTDAPIGTAIGLNFENSNTVLADNYPTGRQSIFSAKTTHRNEWHTIEFEYTSSPDANASVLDVNQMALLVAPNTYTGYTFYFDNVRIGETQEAVAPVLSYEVLENYNGTSKISIGNHTGVYTANVANPAPNVINNSSQVASYKRNNTEVYDVLFFNGVSSIEDAGEFKAEEKRIYVDVYSTAPVGTPITLNLENSAKSTPENYPTGRNSTYHARTTKQNEWETLVFYYNSSPDGATSNVSINQLVFLFDPGKSTSHLFYIDNIRIGNRKEDVKYVVDNVYEDYDAQRNIAYASSTGSYTVVSNPATSPVNASAMVAKYVRNSEEEYDVLFFNNTLIEDASVFEQGTKKFALDLYTNAPVGTVISWQLESSPANASGYPTGRHSIYQAAVKKQNEWHTLVFTNTASPDPGTKDNAVNQMVFLFDPGSTTGHTYYLDNLRALKEDGVSTNPGLPSPWASKDIGAVASVGSASYTSGTFTVKGSGNDIWNSADEFQFVYQPLSGDGEIVAKVNDLTNTDAWAKAGVMIRESLDSNSKHVMTAFARGGVVAFQRRTSTASGSDHTGVSGTAPVWVKIARKGNTFTSSYSLDGSTWSVIGTATISMVTDIFVGLSVTSHMDGTLATANFTNVTVQKGNNGDDDNDNNSGACTGSVNADYNFEASGATTNPTLTFKPSRAGVGDKVLILYYSTSQNSTFPGYAVQPNTPYQLNATAGQTVYFYYTYNVPEGGERNTADKKQSFVVGECGTGSIANSSLSNNFMNNSFKETIRMYPNPANSSLQVEVNNEKITSIMLHSTDGKAMLQLTYAKGKQQALLDVSNLKDGLYILKVRTQRGQYVYRIIKE